MLGVYVFDIETDGLDATKIHSIVAMNVETGEIFSGTNHSDEYLNNVDVLHILQNADVIIGHNIICFDLPTIEKLNKWFSTDAVIRDTLVLSRLIWPDIKNRDFGFRQKHPWFPGQLIGRHSLEAWGYRLKFNKGEFGKQTDWQQWSPEMQKYCEQDVRVTALLWEKIQEKNYSQEAVELEHQFQKIIYQQEVNGVYFDTEKAQLLYGELSGRRQKIREELQKVFPPKDKGEWFIPKANNRRYGYEKGVPIWKSKIEEFNPGSRHHVAERLIEKYNWKPTEYTNTGDVKIDEKVLSKLDYPEAKLLTEYYLLQKRIGQLGEGPQAWLNVEKKGKIHGKLVTNGAVTGRCTHHHPNMAQVPSAHAPYGKECRSLFYAPKGYSMVGCDASGLELRCLAHYLASYDNGSYRDELLHGDIHVANQHAAGLSTRDEAKRFGYSFLYGAGDQLIGSLLDEHATETEQIKLGRATKKRFLNKTPALKQLITDVQNKAKARGYLIGLDGRRLKVRSVHSALNLLLQSAGAIVMKKATCLFWDSVEGRDDVQQVLHIHDEFQLYVHNEKADEIGGIARQSIVKAGEYYNFKCPLDGEYKVGTNWAEAH